MVRAWSARQAPSLAAALPRCRPRATTHRSRGLPARAGRPSAPKRGAPRRAGAQARPRRRPGWCLPQSGHSPPPPPPAGAGTTKKLFELFRKLSLGNAPTMRASFTDARGNSPRDGTAHARQGYPSAPAEGLSAEEQAEIRRAGLQSSAADSRQKRATAAQGGGYQQSKPLELTVHSIKMLAHEQKDRHVLPGAQLADLPAEVCPRARLTASTVTFDWSHTLKLDARGQEAGAALRDALFPRRTDGLPASTRRLQVTAASAVPADVRKAFTMFDFDHSGDIDSRELRKALEAMGMETDESQTRGVLAKCVLARPLVAYTHTPRTPPCTPPPCTPPRTYSHFL